MIKSILILSTTLVAIATSCYAQDACRGDPTDVIFLMDASMQADDDFRSALNFVENVTSRFAIGVYDTKVALVKFGNNYRKIFTLATFKNRDDVLSAIRNVTRSGGVAGTHSDLGDALSLAKTQLTVPSYGRRLAARLAVVIVTSRTDSIAASVAINAQALKDKGATIYAIGIGPLLPPATLDTMASGAQTKFSISGYGELATLQDGLVAAICPAPSATPPAPGADLSVADCPPGVPRDKYLQVYGGLCYEFVVYRQKDFWESEKDCASRGGHLVAIRDQATNTYILNELEHVYSIRSAVWIGLHDSGTEGKFVWTDGSAAGFLNFGANGGRDTDNDCIAMDPNPNSNAGMWIEYHCIEGTWTKPIQHGYVCQYLPNGSQTSPVMSVTSTTASASTTIPTTTAAPPPPTTTTIATTVAQTTKTTTTVVPSTTAPQTTTVAPTSGAPTSPSSTTTTAKTTSSDVQVCPPFSCDLDCGLDGYQMDVVGCQLCVCNA